MINEKPILFSTDMVKAILAGNKIQTRRVVKPQFKVAHEVFTYQGNTYVQTELLERDKNPLNGCIKCPYGQAGDKLWVREAWQAAKEHGEYDKSSVMYKADITQRDLDYEGCDWDWRPSIFMPRKFSRITLEITEARVQRVQEISEADAIAEGIPAFAPNGIIQESTIPRKQYSVLWDKINGKVHNRQFTLDDKSNRHWVKDQVGEYSWSSNPWVWCISFKRI
jgi:hypothetical protein